MNGVTEQISVLFLQDNLLFAEIISVKQDLYN